MLNYLLSIANTETLNNGTIHDPATKLKVKVKGLIKSAFTPCKGEVCFFVTTGDETIAFETQGYKHHRQLLILQMISWYCIYKGLFEAKIHTNQPLKTELYPDRASYRSSR